MFIVFVVAGLGVWGGGLAQGTVLYSDMLYFGLLSHHLIMVMFLCICW